jgi:thiol-disulfide isomerase/thioredoxin
MVRIRAPELAGRGWVGAPDDTTLRSLRGRFVLIDFWTSGCVNCLHVLDELRPLEHR